MDDELDISDYAASNEEVADAATPPEAKTPPPPAHVLTIYNKPGFGETYRYNQGAGDNLELDPRDAAKSERLTRYAMESRNARQKIETERQEAIRTGRHDFSHADGLRLQQLESGRASVERDLQNGTITQKDADHMLGLINSGASELQSRKENRLRLEEEAKVKHWTDLNAMRTMTSIRNGQVAAGQAGLNTNTIPMVTPDGQETGHHIGVYTGPDGKVHTFHIQPEKEDLGKEYDAAHKHLQTKDPDTQATIDPKPEDVQKYLEKKREVLDALKKSRKTVGLQREADKLAPSPGQPGYAPPAAPPPPPAAKAQAQQFVGSNSQSPFTQDQINAELERRRKLDLSRRQRETPND